jgi:hypothetical protein
VDPHRIRWQLGMGGHTTIIFLYCLLTLTRGPSPFFWNETFFPNSLEVIKTPKITQKIRTIRIWTFSI